MTSEEMQIGDVWKFSMVDRDLQSHWFILDFSPNGDVCALCMLDSGYRPLRNSRVGQKLTINPTIVNSNWTLLSRSE